MIEIKVAAKETVRVTFGGSNGFDPKAFQFDADNLDSLNQEITNLRERLHSVGEERDQAIRDREEMRLGRNLDRDAILRLSAELSDARQPRVESGTPVYLIDKDLADRIRSIVGVTMPEWRPIEIAPKDGTEILVWSNRGGVSCSKLRNQTWVFPGGFPGVQPTHWLPIPEPPTP